MNAFESYAKAAATHVSNPKPLPGVGTTLAQVHCGIYFLWGGDGEGFAGLQGEIAFAQQQFRDGPESLASNGYYEKGTGQ